MIKVKPSIEKLRELFNLDRLSGELCWRTSPNSRVNIEKIETVRRVA